MFDHELSYDIKVYAAFHLKNHGSSSFLENINQFVLIHTKYIYYIQIIAFVVKYDIFWIKYVTKP